MLRITLVAIAVSSLAGCVSMPSDMYYTADPGVFGDGDHYYGDDSVVDATIVDDSADIGVAGEPDYLAYPSYFNVLWPVYSNYYDPFFAPDFYYDVTFFPGYYGYVGFGHGFGGFAYSPWWYSYWDNAYDWYWWYRQYPNYYANYRHYGSVRNEQAIIAGLAGRERVTHSGGNSYGVRGEAVAANNSAARRTMRRRARLLEVQTRGFGRGDTGSAHAIALPSSHFVPVARRSAILRPAQHPSSRTFDDAGRNSNGHYWTSRPDSRRSAAIGFARGRYRYAAPIVDGAMQPRYETRGARFDFAPSARSTTPLSAVSPGHAAAPPATARAAPALRVRAIHPLHGHE
ncbi:MAG: hypothetical protein WB784_09480 [Rhodanobacteraceae bacterium]